MAINSNTNHDKKNINENTNNSNDNKNSNGNCKPQNKQDCHDNEEHIILSTLTCVR